MKSSFLTKKNTKGEPTYHAVESKQAVNTIYLVIIEVEKYTA